MHSVHVRLSELLEPFGAHIDDWRWCPHHPDVTGPCACRKPGTAMLEDAAAELGLDLARSWMVGDKLLDVEAGLRAGCRAVMVTTGYGEHHQAQAPKGVAVVTSLDEAAALITSQ